MDFRIISDGSKKKKFELKADRVYEIPVRATHIHVRAGKICFGISPTNGDKKTKRGKFFHIPQYLPGKIPVNAVGFLYYRTKAGHFYGEPKFYGPPESRIIPL